MVSEICQKLFKRDINKCTDEEVYIALLHLVKREAKKKEVDLKKEKKKLYYISAEFLIGRLIGNNLINLGLWSEVRKELRIKGKSLANILEREPEPSLGNGGLGRLAACFLDSIATLGLPGDGIGLCYHEGLFYQKFKRNRQMEYPNAWREKRSVLGRSVRKFPVSFGGFQVNAVMYDILITGYENRTNRLHLFDMDSIDPSIIEKGIQFDKSNVRKNLTLFLYPDDSDDAGRLLRVYQQYFMVSAGAQLILAEARERGSNIHDLADYVAIQINDTHPSMVIPELIRLLMEEDDMTWEEATGIVTEICAYTNHTILAEALEKWPRKFIQKVAPQIVPIIDRLNKDVTGKYDKPELAIIDNENRIHMAKMDMHYGHSINGVAALHTEILKKSELKDFYEIYPEKFNNKTNGITFRRWLIECNRPLTHFLDELIGTGYKKDATELKKLMDHVNEDRTMKKILEIKRKKKLELVYYLRHTMRVDVDPNSIFDIQVKRLHEYKRQQLNCLYVIRKYLEIKRGKKPGRKLTVIFGAKAAPAYTIAKDIIHLILCLQKLIEKDKEVRPYLQVIMLENYNVTLAERVIPACDISEQISLASQEASGTGNMKFMLNGAVTLGTEDGANVEIHELVGDDNIYIFGEDSQTVIDRYARGDYRSIDYYGKNPVLKECVDFIVCKPMLKIGDKKQLGRLYNELLSKDWFMTFPDFDSYCATRERAIADYEDRRGWAKKMITNIANAGFFSSDRTIEEYNKDIWKL
ncbi:MAG: glycogen/starch/alpha-glucan family phosphorylase [Eubacterium sp.]|nr:glycogen/starch/alpha-glucan family phosphorylase [Eubacterium sp.]